MTEQKKEEKQRDRQMRKPKGIIHFSTFPQHLASKACIETLGGFFCLFLIYAHYILAARFLSFSRSVYPFPDVLTFQCP